MENNLHGTEQYGGECVKLQVQVNCKSVSWCYKSRLHVFNYIMTERVIW